MGLQRWLQWRVLLDPGRQSLLFSLEPGHRWDFGLTYPTGGLLRPKASTSSRGNPCLQWEKRGVMGGRSVPLSEDKSALSLDKGYLGTRKAEVVGQGPTYV